MAERNAPPAGSAREASMDVTDLWREEMITDRRVGTLRVMTPIRPDGSADPARHVAYVGEAQMMTNMGASDSLAQAVAGYGEAAHEAFERTMRELQELRRQSASSLVLPGQGGGGGGFGPGGMPPGLGGGGKIQMP